MTEGATPPEFIESTAGRVGAELARRGIAPDQRVAETVPLTRDTTQAFQVRRMPLAFSARITSRCSRSKV